MGATAETIGWVEKQARIPKKSERAPVVLTARDRELFVHLAIARFLSTEQIGRLVFAGKTDSIVRRRLSRLAGGDHPYLQRLPFQTRGDGPVVAWALLPLGHLAARNLFGAIPEQQTFRTPGPEFLEHQLRLSELYLALAAAAYRKKLSFERRPFRWLANSTTARFLRPDATLELLHEGRRVFVEVETANLTLSNSVKGKVERYAHYLASGSVYSQDFPDGWPAALMFIVPSNSLRDAINEHVAGHLFPIRAVTLQEAPAELCRAADLPVPPAPPTAEADHALAPDEIRAIYDFYNSVIMAISAVRQFVKNNPQVAATLPVPVYPPSHQRMRDLCLRLTRSSASQD